MIRGKLVFKSNGFNKTGFMNFLKVKSQLISDFNLLEEKLKNKHLMKKKQLLKI